MSTTAIIAICIASLVVGWAIAILIAMRSRGAGVLIFVATSLVAVIVLIGYADHLQSVQVGKTRDAIEQRYDVDFSTGWFDHRGRGGSSYKDGALYECDIKGVGDKARMFCDEPPRPEFNN